jgi:hypothetical protein
MVNYVDHIDNLTNDYMFSSLSNGLLTNNQKSRTPNPPFEGSKHGYIDYEVQCVESFLNNNDESSSIYGSDYEDDAKDDSAESEDSSRTVKGDDNIVMEICNQNENKELYTQQTSSVEESCIIGVDLAKLSLEYSNYYKELQYKNKIKMKSEEECIAEWENDNQFTPPTNQFIYADVLTDEQRCLILDKYESNSSSAETFLRDQMSLIKTLLPFDNTQQTNSKTFTKDAIAQLNILKRILVKKKYSTATIKVEKESRKNKLKRLKILRKL